MITKKATPNMHSLLLFGLSLLLMLGSCRKEDDIPSILSASISQESNSVVVREGNPIVYNYTLSQALTEDLPLELSISRTKVSAPIDLDDYSPEIEYKGNLDTEWRKVDDDNTLVFPKGSTGLKVRINTIDDTRIEVRHEQFHFSIEANQENFIQHNFQISNLNDLTPVLSEVRDNDEFEQDEDDLSSGYRFTVDDDYNFTLVSASRGHHDILNPFGKLFFDKIVKEKDLPSKMKKDIIAVLKSGDQTYKIASFILGTHDGGGLLGYVAPIDANWELFLALSAYPNAFDDAVFDSDGSRAHPYKQYTQAEFEAFLEEKYNSNSVFGTVLVHEFGHLQTLGATSQWNPFSFDDGGYCPTEIFTGCLKEDSFVNQFKEKYSDLSFGEKVEPEFVTPYAESSYLEDVAEVFTYHILQKDIPSLQATSSTALDKIHFMANYAPFQQYNYREKIRPLFETESNGGIILPHEAYMPINAFINGRHSCVMSREKLLERIEDNREERSKSKM